MQTYPHVVFVAIFALSTFFSAQLSAAPAAPLSTDNMRVATAGDDARGRWVCDLASATPLTAERLARQTLPDGYRFPFGFVRYRIDQCSYTGIVSTVPPPGFRALQFLTIELP